TQPSCFGSNNGSATVSVSGGVAPYTYSWNTPTAQTGSTAYNLTAGSYTVVVKDAEQKSTSAQVTLDQPSQLSITATARFIVKYGGSTSVTLAATGGVPPYSFTGPVSNVPAGTYTYTVKDSKGCLASTTITITQPSPTGKFKKYDLRQINNSTPTQKSTQSIQEQDVVKTYPNPATSNMMVNIGNSIRGKGTMTIVGMSGVVISSIRFDKSSHTYSTTVNVSMLAPGTYILKIEFENEKPITSKFIKL
ncbi:MAG TPA: T9SS type A sorting domain-containing protein, partial [Chitinophagaceae bacterium]|nr:T9SS type A sorting domain-containing protein [Chitinophagaceae bacterium]